jgi:hypothetical protein
VLCALAGATHTSKAKHTSAMVDFILMRQGGFSAGRSTRLVVPSR